MEVSPVFRIGFEDAIKLLCHEFPQFWLVQNVQPCESVVFHHFLSEVVFTLEVVSDVGA